MTQLDKKGTVATRPTSKIAPGWWDFTTLDSALIQEAAKLTPDRLQGLSRDGFYIHFYDTLEDFYLAEALEYIHAWSQSTAEKPVGICGPIGPTEQLPLVARLVNELQLSLRNAHFWAMDEWVVDGKEVPPSHPLSFARANMELCFGRIDKRLAMPPENLHFPTSRPDEYSRTFEEIRCAIMQGGQGEAKHWAFNDPLPRRGDYQEMPPSAKEYLELGARVVDLHPLTIMQNARTSGGGNLCLVPQQAVTVGPLETWKAEKVSIWHAGTHDNPFGMRLTSLMISTQVADAAVPMSLLALHPNVHFHFYRPALHNSEAGLH